MNAPLLNLREETLEIPDLRFLGLGLNECERALLDCSPVVLNDRLYAKLYARGVHGVSINGRGPFEALCYDAVVFQPGGRFEFGRDMRDATGAKVAIFIPARDEDGELADLAAWDLDDGALALWRGHVAMLGEDQLSAPRIESPAIEVFADVASWLRASRRGVVIIDPQRARWRLAGEQLAVDSQSFGRHLEKALALPRPQIFVRRAA